MKIELQAMHVLTLTPFYPTANDDATGCFVAESVAGLRSCGVKTSVIAVTPWHQKRDLTASDTAPRAQWQTYLTLPGNEGLPFSGRFLFRGLLDHVWTLHEASPIDVIHAHAALPCGHAAMLLSQSLHIPFVVTVHGLDAFLRRQVTGWSGERCGEQCERVYRAASRVICISGRVEEVIRQNMPDLARTVVVFNGVDADRFSPVQAGDHEQASILSVGNLIPIKGHGDLLRAIAAISGETAVRCEIVGEGPERAALTRLAEDLGIGERVGFLGRRSRSEVTALMQKSTIFALPSRYEGLGCVYLEAMSTGRPAIGCLGQGIEEVIRSRENGWLVEPENVQELAQALEKLLGDRALRTSIGNKARSTVLEGLTLQHQAKALLSVYEDAIT